MDISLFFSLATQKLHHDFTHASVIYELTLKVPEHPFTIHSILNLISRIKHVRLQEAFTDSCQLRQFCHPTDVVGDVVGNEGKEAPPSPRHHPPPPLLPNPLLSLSACTLFLMILSHTGCKLYPPPSLFRLGFTALVYMASFTPFANYLDSVVKISVCFSVL